MNQRIIFHYPGPFYDVLDTGEKKRPVKLLQAFRALDCQLTIIIGSHEERKRKVDSLLQQGLQNILGYYLESSNMPIYLAGGNRLVDNPDVKLIKAILKSQIPSSLFYRDAYWLKQDFQRRLGIKKWPALFLYKKELKLFSQFDLMYLPGLEIQKILPGKLPKTQELPSGTDCPSIQHSKKFNKLKLIYMGNISKPYWNISGMLDLISTHDKIFDLTVITPNKHMDYLRKEYDVPNNVKVCHVDGEELSKELIQADIGLMFEPDAHYMSRIVNMKFYEYIGHGLPVVAYEGSRCAELLKCNHAGWIVNAGKLKKKLCYLYENKDEVVSKKKTAENVRFEFSWQSRAKTILENFYNIRSGK